MIEIKKIHEQLDMIEAELDSGPTTERILELIKLNDSLSEQLEALFEDSNNILH